MNFHASLSLNFLNKSLGTNALFNLSILRVVIVFIAICLSSTLINIFQVARCSYN